MASVKVFHYKLSGHPTDSNDDNVEYVLQLPRMSQYPSFNSILVCNNAKVHKGARINKMCHEAGIRVIYLPPYCPELNPIEMCFSVIKSHLRRSQVLVRAPNEISSIYKATGKLITVELCEQLYRHAGYACTDAPYDSSRAAWVGLTQSCISLVFCFLAPFVWSQTLFFLSFFF